MCERESSRRGFLGGSIGGFFAFSLMHRLDALFAQGAPARRCLVLWMNGGPSQIDTFDPKPGVSTGGGVRAIETEVRGVRISEHLPQMARRMSKLSILRSIHSNEGDHARGQYFLRTGYPLVDGFPRPSAGSVISAETPAAPFPKFVSLGGQALGPAYLGPAHAPFSIEDPAAALQTLRALERRRSRLRLLRELGGEFNERHGSPELERRQEAVGRIESLIDTRFAEALDLSREPEKSRARYGNGAFGRLCLAGRRLLELGVNFVEVQMGGWDTHVDNGRRVKELCGELDASWAALMDDLDAGGLLRDTVVLWMGEFGRTPAINAAGGRDHYPQVTCAVVGGGGIPGGRVVGDTGKLGERAERDPVTVPDLFATLFRPFGVAADRKFRTDFGGAAYATDGGRPIAALR